MSIIRIISQLFLLVLSVGTSAQDRPNILWLTYEDTSPEFIGAYGNSSAKTFFLDKLAAEGVTFTRAFSPGSVCSPSRSALITGVKTYELGTGNHRSAYPIPDYIKGFPTYLRNTGYYTSNNSKTDYNVANAKGMIAKSWNESSNTAGWWNKEAGQPFFAVFNSNSSHQSRTMTNPYAQYREMIYDQLPDSLRTTDKDFPMPPFYRDSPEMRKQMARVYNSITKTNVEFQELFDRLQSDGLLENTIIFSFADHGEGMPRMKTNGIGIGHRIPFTIWFPEKYKHLSPWGTGGVVTDELIDFTDLAPTVLALAGVEVPAYMKGNVLLGKEKSNTKDHLFLSSDRSDESYDLTRTVVNKKYAYTRVFMPNVQELRYLLYMDLGEITHHIRDDFNNNRLNEVQTTMLRPRSLEYLYDLENDPWEITNLAALPAYRSKVVKFRKLLQDHLSESNDVLFLPEYEISELSKSTTAYEFREQHDLADVHKIAQCVGFETRQAKQLRKKGLTDENKWIRYWALQNYTITKSAFSSTETQAVEACLADEYPPNRVLAASILSDRFNDKSAKNILISYFSDENDHLSNLALQRVLYQKNAHMFGNSVDKLSKERKEHFMTNRTVEMYRYIYQNKPLVSKN
jgi:arylsulfatase A-like enzyme